MNLNAQAVRNGYANLAGLRYDVLDAGYNAYENGTDLDYQAAVFTMYPNFLRQSASWPTLVR